MKWYVVQVTTGKELKVRDALQAKHIPAKVPQEERQIRQGGSWAGKLYVLMPGYVFVGSDDFGADDYYAIKKTADVLRILGTPPQPISYQEAEYINLLAPDDNPLQPSLVEIVGGEAQVVDGVLARIPSRLLKVEARRRRAKVSLTVLGEEKIVEFAVVVEGAQDGPEEDSAGGGDS